MPISKIPDSILDRIKEILNRGNQVEIKKERENIVVVEIKRQVKEKVIAIGQ